MTTEYRCGDCGKVFSSRQHMWDHIGSEECQAARIRCGDCGQVFMHPRLLWKHRAFDSEECQAARNARKQSDASMVALSRGLLRSMDPVSPHVRGLDGTRPPAATWHCDLCGKDVPSEYYGHLCPGAQPATPPPAPINYRAHMKPTSSVLYGSASYAIAIAVLADGLAAMCGPHCARCEKPMDDSMPGGKWCLPCYSRLMRVESPGTPADPTTRREGPRLLPRPGAIVLAVDDPNGDDVAEG